MEVALGVGSSLGDRVAHLAVAIRRLNAMPGIRVVRVSRLYRTPPMRGGTARGWFLNAVAKIETELTAEALLQICRKLEEDAGRRRARFWGDRPLDLDILLVDEQVIETETLRVPHPGIAQRPFVHRPLAEVWPDAIDARTGRPWTDAEKIDIPRAVPVSTLVWRS